MSNKFQSRIPPYFDRIFEGLKANDHGMETAFGQHVHWGYWPTPQAETCTPEEFRNAAEHLCQVIFEIADIRDGSRILDVGCGFGGTICSLNASYSDLNMVGVNVDQRQLQRARELVQSRSANTIEFLQADAADIPLPDQSFDVVLSVESAFHFDRPGFFAEVARLLTPQGSLTISDFVISEKASKYLQDFDLFADTGIKNSYGDVDLSWSIERYRLLAEQNGLKIQQQVDITENTLPTYDFLYAHTTSLPPEWQDPDFLRATRLLEKSSRKGLMHYLIVQFTRA